jgi:hypothetical protein
MNNVNPPSRFTACILLHTYTQERLQSSAESGFRLQVSGIRICRRESLAEESCSAVLWLTLVKSGARRTQPVAGKIEEERMMDTSRTVQKIVRKKSLREQSADVQDWQMQPYQTRLAALEQVRREYHQWR